MLAGIDLGNKKAGTTAICIGNPEGEISIISCSQKGKDADRFLIDNVSIYKIEKLFIDAPLSLPGVYRDPGSYDDYFYRKCDREIGAMSPMFLGGLTARAVRLKDYFESAGLKVFEVWPTKMAESAGILRDSYKKNLADLSSAIGILNGSGYLKNDFSASNWHEFDSVLAYISGLRIVRKSAVSYGDRREGLIYV